jgi:hypothetical protein
MRVRERQDGQKSDAVHAKVDGTTLLGSTDTAKKTAHLTQGLDLLPPTGNDEEGGDKIGLSSVVQKITYPGI